MDKQKNNKAIVLTIGGRKRKREEELLVQGWKKGKEESAVAAEPEPKGEEEEFQWLLPPEEEKEGNGKILYAPIKKVSVSSKDKGRSIAVRLLLIVISAIVIGLLFGYGMIKMVTKKAETPPQAALQEEKLQEEKQKAQDTPSVPAATDAKLPAVAASIVQGGLFSTEKAAASVKQELNEKGIPAVVIQQGKQFILILGAGGEKETAKLLATLYEAEGAAVYAKTLEILPAGNAGSKKQVSTMTAMGAVFSLIAEESAKMAAGTQANGPRLSSAEKQLQAISPEGKDLIELKPLLAEALKQAKSGQPSAGKAAQEQLLVFLSAYNQLK